MAFVAFNKVCTSQLSFSLEGLGFLAHQADNAVFLVVFVVPSANTVELGDESSASDNGSCDMGGGSSTLQITSERPTL